jgi:hypothetical protein
MRIFDERIQINEVKDLSEEMVELLVQAMSEDYSLNIDADGQSKLTAEIIKVLTKFFNVKKG